MDRQVGDGQVGGHVGGWHVPNRGQQIRFAPCTPEVLQDFRPVGAQRLPIQWLSRWVKCSRQKTGFREQESCLCGLRAPPAPEKARMLPPALCPQVDEEWRPKCQGGRWCFEMKPAASVHASLAHDVKRSQFSC